MDNPPPLAVLSKSAIMKVKEELSAWGRDANTQVIAEDPAAFMELERKQSAFPLLADVGKHLLVIGSRPN